MQFRGRNGAVPLHLGYKLILSSSHMGSPRFMTQLFQDAIAICRHFVTKNNY